MEWVLGVAGGRDAATSGVKVVYMRLAQMMGQQKNNNYNDDKTKQNKQTLAGFC